MRMRKLETLSLSYNQLISIAPLRKAYIPRLRQLQLDHNLFHGDHLLHQS